MHALSFYSIMQEFIIDTCCTCSKYIGLHFILSEWHHILIRPIIILCGSSELVKKLVSLKFAILVDGDIIWYSTQRQHVLYEMNLYMCTTLTRNEEERT